MKNFFLLALFLLVSPISMACETKKFKVFYIPIEVQFVVPPTREDILKRANFEINSSQIGCLFDLITNQNGRAAKDNDYGRFRILIQDQKEKKELIILFDKAVFFENKIYKVSHKKIDVILKELKAKSISIK